MEKENAETSKNKSSMGIYYVINQTTRLTGIDFAIIRKQ